MTLDRTALGLSFGILWGATVFLATLWIYAIGGGDTMALLKQFYFGYSITPVGAVIGLVYGFIDGFICGWVLAYLYNRLAKKQ
ncbi:MAG: bacteriophage holin [Deltaproteobacteria bacterium]|nr:bacteriophage holin [Deltaproteobacteria bacterium]